MTFKHFYCDYYFLTFDTYAHSISSWTEISRPLFVNMFLKRKHSGAKTLSKSKPKREKAESDHSSLDSVHESLCN